MPAPPIKLQREECELTVQFQLDELSSYFKRSSSSRYTDYFGPGLRFGSYSFVGQQTEGSHLGVYLYTSKEYPPLTISWNVSVRSIAGQLHQTRSMSYTFKSGEAIGWSKFLTEESFRANSIMKSEDAMVISANLKFTPLWPVVSRPTLDVLHQNVVGTDNQNVRYIVYDKRSPSGKLSAPRAVFASKDALVEKCNAFADICKTGLEPICGILMTKTEPVRNVAFTDYRDDDSDFEDEPDPDPNEDYEMVPENASAALVLSGATAVAQPDARGRSDSTVMVKSEHPPPQVSVEPSVALRSTSGPSITVLGAASRTWEAILYWLYSGVIVFAPLSSSGKQKRASAIEEYRTANPNRPAPVSCKSVYRIADSLKLEDLKKRALEHLESQLTIDTFLHELFSEFTSRYPEVRRAEMLSVVKHWDELKTSDALKAKMMDVASGKLPHAGPVLADLLLRTSVVKEGSPASSDKR